MAAEFVACYEAFNHVLWLWNFVTGMRILSGIERPLKLYCDNKSAALYFKNNKSSSRSRYIDIKFLIVKKRVQSGQIFIEHIGPNSMIADPLIKGITPKVFHEHTASMMLYHLRISWFTRSPYICFIALFCILDTFFVHLDIFCRNKVFSLYTLYYYVKVWSQ